jgi:hypothetical protein
MHAQGKVAQLVRSNDGDAATRCQILHRRYYLQLHCSFSEFRHSAYFILHTPAEQLPAQCSTPLALLKRSITLLHLVGGRFSVTSSSSPLPEHCTLASPHAASRRSSVGISRCDVYALHARRVGAFIRFGSVGSAAPAHPALRLKDTVTFQAA